VLTAILLGASLYGIYYIRLRRIRERTKELEKAVKERTRQILHQKEEIEVINEEIEAQRNEIVAQKIEMEDSIEVGRMIQMNVLPPVSRLRKVFPESFIYYQPKDIVSGDFYWIFRQEPYTFVAACDCTGHGVAGAFLTIIGHSHLNEILSNKMTTDPAEILDKLNQKMINTLRQQSKGSKSKDGMDITMCVFEDNSDVVRYAGAVNGLYIIRNGSDEIERQKVDFFSIGIPVFGDVKNFKSFETKVETGDQIYMMSDGIIDQFGGENGEEKFKSGRLKKLLIEHKDDEMDEQGKTVRKTMDEWMMQAEQTDDMLMIGIKI
jgi:serine phosphatase RsbU (regulator of sigma subunit)